MRVSLWVGALSFWALALSSAPVMAQDYGYDVYSDEGYGDDSSGYYDEEANGAYAPRLTAAQCQALKPSVRRRYGCRTGMNAPSFNGFGGGGGGFGYGGTGGYQTGQVQTAPRSSYSNYRHRYQQYATPYCGGQCGVKRAPIKTLDNSWWR